MKLLLDQGLPRTSAAVLRESGVDAVHTAECGLATAADDAILAFAREQDRVVVTLDADFHAIMALSGALHPSVVRIRIEGLRARELAELVQRVMALCADDLARGALLSVEPDRVRRRSLPVSG